MRRPTDGTRRGALSLPVRRLRSRVHERARRGQQLARLEPGLQAGEDHRPAAIELLVGALAKLVMRHRQAAGVTDRFDLPGDPRGPLLLHVVTPESPHALDQPPRRIDLEVLALSERRVSRGVARRVPRALRPVGIDPNAEVVLAPDLAVGD